MAHKPQFTPRIVVIEGKDKGKVIAFPAGTTIIGRSKGDVLIHDARISRSHVAIEWNPHTARLTFADLKSLNGTLLNGETVETGELRDGDRLQLGNTLFDCQVIELPETTKRSDTISEMRRREPRPEPLATPVFDEPPRPAKESPADTFDEPLAGKKRERSSPKRQSEPRMDFEMAPDVARDERTKSGFQLSGWRRVYLSLPRKTRVYSLCALTLIFTMIYSFSGGEGGDAGSDRDITSIRALESQGKISEAISRAEQLKTAHPERTDYHRVLGDLYAQSGKIALAIEAYLTVLNLNPQEVVLHVHLARLYLASGQANEAEIQNRQIDRILIEGPHSKEFFVEVANLYMNFPTLDVPPKKMIIIGQALQNKFAPGETVGMKLEASGLIIEERATEAIVVLEKARQIDPKDETILQYLVVARIRAKDPQGATKVVQQWMADFPNAVQPRLFMAHWKFETHAYADSLAELQAILTITAGREDDVNVLDALSLMAKVHLAQNQVEEARGSLIRACQLGHLPSCDHPLLKSVPSPPAQETAAAEEDSNP